MGPIRNFGPFFACQYQIWAYLGVKQRSTSKSWAYLGPKKGPLLKMWAYRHFWTKARGAAAPHQLLAPQPPDSCAYDLEHVIFQQK